MSKRGGSSGRWLERQQRDQFVRRAQQEGNISRAHYKLEQLDKRFKLVGRHTRILELGAAPGGWTRYLSDRAPDGVIIAVDPLPVSATASVHVLCGMLGEESVDEALQNILGERGVDLVLSDMAPNLSGVRAADQASAIYLAELALEAADRWLQAGGNLVVKLFQGEGVDNWLMDARKMFKSVRQVKPEASRPESRELYAVALGRRPISAETGV